MSEFSKAYKVLNIVGKMKNSLFNPDKISIDVSYHPIWITYFSHPPVRYSFHKFARMRHYLNCLPNSCDRPFIIETEHPLILCGKSRDYVFALNSVDRINNIFEHPNCKHVILPTRRAINEFRKYFPSKNILQKIIPLHPGFPTQAQKPFLKRKDFRILNIGNKFWGKGTHIAIEIFKRIKRQYSFVELDLVCGDVPNDVVLTPGINLINTPKLSQSIKSSLYTNADIFLFPCLHDSFGVYLEALSFGVPMVGTDIYDKSELIVDGHTGFIIPTPLSLYDGPFGVKWKNWGEFNLISRIMFLDGCFENMINSFVEKICFMIDNREIITEMGVNSQEYHKSEFSISQKNKQICEIYRAIPH